MPSGYYVCSKGFKPGIDSIWPVRIAEHFRDIANEIGLPYLCEILFIKGYRRRKVRPKQCRIKNYSRFV